jgi:hypothetical protein
MNQMLRQATTKHQPFPALVAYNFVKASRILFKIVNLGHEPSHRSFSTLS